MGKLAFPSISVIIPAYNRGKTIIRCIDSIAAQTINPLEIIVVDDCSTDDTMRIVQGLGNKGVRYISLEAHSGAQAARNRGIREAKGDWIAFQDSDDEWLPRKLEKQLEALKKYKYDPWTVVHTNAVRLNSETGQRAMHEIAVIDGQNVYASLLTSNGPLFPTFLVSKAALGKIGYLDEQVPSFQEWDTSIRLARECRFVHLLEPLFVYHTNARDSISSDRQRDIAGYQYIIDKHESDIKRVCGYKTWERHLFIQLEKCLCFKLTSDADKYFDRIDKRPLKYWIYWVLRQLHVSPKLLTTFGVVLNSRE